MNIHHETILFRAMEFANSAHRNQTRKTSSAPYIIHPFHVMWLLRSHDIDPDNVDHMPILVASLLHDTVEDNPEEISLELIERHFGAEAARIVKGVTLDPVNPNKRASRRKIIDSDWKIQTVKVGDILSNTIGTVLAIKKFGLAAVQKCFNQPIAERVVMEREFTGALPWKKDYLAPLIASTDDMLDELEVLAK